MPGGAFGWGIDQDILDGYTFIAQNYEPGDQICLFGFSRGAYTVRSLAGLINCSGLLVPDKVERLKHDAYELYRDREITPSHPTAVDFRQNNGDRVPILLMGCWDTVGSLGIPDVVSWLPIDSWINQRYRFHDETLSSIIQNACHAVAIDERRKALDVTPMQKSDDPNSQAQVVKQIWFPGVHGCVGGGKRINRGLSDAALKWMIDEASVLGLTLDISRITDGLVPDHTADFDDGVGILGLTGLIDRDLRKHNTRFDDLHDSTKNRWRDVEYRPPKLRESFEQLLDAHV